MMRRIVMTLVLLAAASLACKQRSTIRVDPEITSKLAIRSGAVFARPAVDAAFNRLLAALAADREVRERGEKLLNALAADPVISGHLTNMMNELQGPELRGVVARLMEQNPDATPDEIGELFAKRFDTNWSMPSVNEAWMRAWRTLRTRLHVRDMPAVLQSQLGKRLERYIDVRSSNWGKRLAELNGGREPSPERAGELYMDHAWSDARLEQFFVTVLSNPQFQVECVALARQLLQVNGIETTLQEAAAAMLSDATVRGAAVGSLGELMRDAPSVDALARDLARLVKTPVTADSINKVIARLFGDPRFPKLIADGMERLIADPPLSAAFNTLLDDW